MSDVKFTDIPENIIKHILNISYPDISKNENYRLLECINKMTNEIKISFIEHMLDNITISVMTSYNDIQYIRYSVYLFYKYFLVENNHKPIDIDDTKPHIVPWEYINYILKKSLDNKKINSMKFDVTDKIAINIGKPLETDMTKKKYNTILNAIHNHILYNSVNKYKYLDYVYCSNSLNYKILLDVFRMSVDADRYISYQGMQNNDITYYCHHILYTLIGSANIVLFEDKFQLCIYCNYNWYKKDRIEFESTILKNIAIKYLRKIIHMLEINKSNLNSSYNIFYNLLSNCVENWKKTIINRICYTRYFKTLDKGIVDSKKSHKNSIHFLNGHYNILTKTFTDRFKKEEYVTKFFEFEYIETELINQTDYDFIELMIKQQFKEDKEDNYKMCMSFMMLKLKNLILYRTKHKINRISILNMNERYEFLPVFNTIDNVLFETCFDIEDRHSVSYLRYSNNYVLSDPATHLFIRDGVNFSTVNLHSTNGFVQSHNVLYRGYAFYVRNIMSHTLYKNVFIRLLFKHDKLFITEKSKELYKKIVKIGTATI